MRVVYAPVMWGDVRRATDDLSRFGDSMFPSYVVPSERAMKEEAKPGRNFAYIDLEGA